LDDLSLTDLKKLGEDIETAIFTFEQRQKETVFSALEEKAKKFGFALADLFSDAVGKLKRKGASRAKAAPKYANPADPSVAWSGRGRQPGWYKDAVAAGKLPESMGI